MSVIPLELSSELHTTSEALALFWRVSLLYSALMPLLLNSLCSYHSFLFSPIVRLHCIGYQDSPLFILLFQQACRQLGAATVISAITPGTLLNDLSCKTCSWSTEPHLQRLLSISFWGTKLKYIEGIDFINIKKVLGLRSHFFQRDLSEARKRDKE